MRPNYTEIGHSDLLRQGLFNQREIVQLLPVTRILFADFIQPEEVDKVDQLQMAREEFS